MKLSAFHLFIGHLDVISVQAPSSFIYTILQTIWNGFEGCCLFFFFMNSDYVDNTHYKYIFSIYTFPLHSLRCILMRNIYFNVFLFVAFLWLVFSVFYLSLPIQNEISNSLCFFYFFNYFTFHN